MIKSSILADPPSDPELLKQGEQYKNQLLSAIEASGLSERSIWLGLIKNVCSCSPFIASALGKYLETLRGLISSGELIHASGEQYYQVRLPAAPVLALMDEPEFMAMLRQYRQREMVRIGIRDLLGWAELNETLSDLSALADTCIRVSLQKATNEMTKLYGVAYDQTGDVQELIVMAMGKLGGHELNYSSDIDLIFFYADAGQTQTSEPNQRAIEIEQYFTRIGQRVIKYLNEATQDSHVFRVDMRLRPYGDSGALVMNFTAAEAYYHSQGRDWERYAFIKARAVTGKQVHIDELEQILKPFIYRRYLDYGAFEALREMKAKLMKDLARKYRADNVKMGPGGIREIEFIAQAFQLIRGGKEPVFQQRSILKVLQSLAERGVMDSEVCASLVGAYHFLRRTENRLQMVNDQQVHTLPASDLEQARIAYAMGYQDWYSFKRALSQHTTFVHDCFMDVFAEPLDLDGQDKERAALKEVWLHIDKAWAKDKINALGFADSEYVCRELLSLSNSHLVSNMSVSGRSRLDRMMPVLIDVMAKQTLTNTVIGRLLDFVRAVGRRSVYLALLVEYPRVLDELIKLFSASSWLADYLTRYPVLLDSLITQRDAAVIEKATLKRQLEELLSDSDEDDAETQWNLLRQFKNEQVLWVATADIDAVLPIMKVSDRLTELAEVMLQQVCEMAMQHLQQRDKGCLQNGDEAAELAVIAYGKLGGIELGYGSDLDVIFLYTESTQGLKEDQASFFLRLARRIVQIMTSHTTSGVLYEMDLRLRPDGDAGLMVHSLDSFARYQREKAWTWEHQALVRARLVVGSEQMQFAFSSLREEILCQSRDRLTLKQEIVQMRERMRKELSKSQEREFDLKQDKGGIVDIEFMVQYTVLANANQSPEIVRYTDNIRILESCSEAGILAQETVSFLIEAYQKLRAELHRLSLLNQSAVIHDISTVGGYIKGVADIWDNMFEV